MSEDEVKTSNKDGGARRIRTDDILLAKQALYQLSYGPSHWCELLAQQELVAKKSLGVRFRRMEEW